MRGRSLSRVVVGQLDLWLMTLATGIALAPFGRSFAGSAYLVPVTVAVALPAIASLITVRRPLLVAVATLTLLGLVVLVLVVYPHTTAFGIPSGETADALVEAVTSWWRQFLSSGVPSRPMAALLVAPVLLGLVCSSVTSQIVLRTPWSRAQAVPVVVVFIVATAFSPGSTVLGVLAVTGLAFVLLLAMVVRSTGRRERRQLDAALIRGVSWPVTMGSLGLATAIGAVFGLAQGFVVDSNRFAARDLVPPPIDVDDELSPLTLVRWKKDAERSATELFAVRLDHLPAGSDLVALRIPLAYLTVYDGATWTVDAREFKPAGTTLPPPSGMNTPIGETITQRYTMDADTPTSFVPSLPGVVALDREDGPVAFSVRSGTLLLGDAPGASYDVTSSYRVAPVHACPAASERPGTFDSDLDPLVEVPSEVAGLGPYVTLYRWVRPDLEDPLERLEQIDCLLRTGGEYVNNPAARQGHSIARLAEVAVDSKIGSDEQYASIIALAARMHRLPSRVAVGFELPPELVVAGEPIAVRADQVTAWPEVFVGGEVGWQRFDPTGEEEDVVDQTAAEVVAQPADGVRPPPERRSGPNEVRPQPAQPLFRERSDDTRWILPVVLLAAAVVAVVTILVAKWLVRRRRRRARDPKVAIVGAWAEARSHLVQAGVAMTAGSTAREIAGMQQLPKSVQDQTGMCREVAKLADCLDAALCSPRPPRPEMVHEAWQLERALRAVLRRGVPMHRRVVGLVDPRPLLAVPSARHRTRRRSLHQSLATKSPAALRRRGE